jgi:predicted nucleic acid-binding protein
MKLFLDSSAFAKRFIDESGSRQVEALCSQATELGLSVICVPEIISALNRRLREKSLFRPDYARVKQRLSQDVHDAIIINLTTDVIQSCIEILETNPLRTLAALHIACAMAWEADLFASADHRQIVAARTAPTEVSWPSTYGGIHHKYLDLCRPRDLTRRSRWVLRQPLRTNRGTKGFPARFGSYGDSPSHFDCMVTAEKPPAAEAVESARFAGD